jgi:mono/diheme cytochrome c family protein
VKDTNDLSSTGPETPRGGEGGKGWRKGALSSLGKPKGGHSGAGFFWTIAIALVVVYGIVKIVMPFVSRRVTGLPFPLPVPATLVLFYMVLTIVALFLYVTFSEERLDAFIDPIKRFLTGRYGTMPRSAVLVIVPLIIGWQVFDFTVPRSTAPSSLRIQHPSSNFPKKLETLKNPLDEPSDAAVNAFIEQAKSNTVEFAPQVAPDVERWMEANSDRNALEAIPTEAMKKFLDELKAGNVNKETVSAAISEKNLFEGRALYAMNCRPCHGDSVSGDGPMADGFKLRPIDFTENGTIETIVEGYTFWRVTNGGPGLPVEATPWDSAMPVWGHNISEEERWKIIMAEYDLAQKTPRITEKHEAEAEGEAKKH